MNTTKTYRIELRYSNPYIGSRNGGNKVEEEGLTLSEATEWLLDRFNRYSERHANNWGVARMLTSKHLTEGTYAYGKVGNKCVEWDSRVWEMVEE